MSPDATGPAWVVAALRLVREARAAGAPVGAYQWATWCARLGLPLATVHRPYLGGVA